MYYIGIDLGGTNIKGALVSETGEIAREVSRPTRVELGAEAVCDGIAAVITELSSGVDRTSLGGVGLGCPGTVDDETGRVLYANNLGWKNFDLRAAVKSRTDFDLRIGNDANVAALAEVLVGCAKGAQSAVIVTLGTGVGGGIIINGKVYSGSNFAGGELGHTVIVVDGRPCTCGRHGCWETYASATGLIKTTKEHMKDAPKDSPIWTIVDGDESKVNGRTAFDAMRAGDPVGKAVVDEYIKYLSVGLTDVINIFQPAILCIGGGICNEGETLLAPVRAFIDREQYAMNSTKKTKVCKAQLGNDAGIIGAALLGKQED